MSAFHVMAKPIGSACNLQCHYCYYLSKAQLLEQRPGARMAPDVLERYIRQTIEGAAGSEVTFTWQGGEPTLVGLDFFRQVLKLQARYGGVKQRINNDLQTNGILLDDAWCEFLKTHEFLVGLSIDGPPELHDACRVAHHQRPTSERVLAAVRRLQRYRIDFSTLTVVGRHNAHAGAAVYQFLAEQLGSRAIQLIPCVEPKAFQSTAPQQWRAAGLPDARDRAQLADFVTEYSVTPPQWGNFLCQFFDNWVQRGLGRVMVNLFESAVLQTLGYPAVVCSSSQHCGHGVVVERDGSVFTCDHYVYPSYRLGNIALHPLKELATSPRQMAFGQAKSDALPDQCRRCPYLKLCWGECPRNRFTRAANGEVGLNYLCAGQQQFFAHAMPALRQIAKVVARHHTQTQGQAQAHQHESRVDVAD